MFTGRIVLISLPSLRRLCRCILVDYGRSRLYAKRLTGGSALPLDEAIFVFPERAKDMIMVDEALDERKARVAQLRFFAGFSIQETTEL